MHDSTPISVTVYMHEICILKHDAYKQIDSTIGDTRIR